MKFKHYIIAASCILSTSSAWGGIKPRGFDYNPVRHTRSIVDNNDRTRLSVGKRSTAPLSCFGSPKIPVVLVQFPDLQFSVAEGNTAVKEFYDKYLNGLRDGGHYTGAGSVGAVSEYFRDQSYGLFTPEFVPIGPVTLDSSYVYYGKNSGSAKDVNISKFYKESIEKAQAAIGGLSWDTFDNNSDGVIDMAYFIFAGNGENDSKNRDPNTIWPKESGNGDKIGGIRYGAYACCNELYKGVADGIGVMCHELSHAIGLPDLYDVNYEEFGMDYWDLMDAGNYCANGYCPCGYSAYEKDFMGWRELITLEAGVGTDITLYPMSNSKGYAYKIVNQENPDEYYIIENRQNKGWDRYIAYSNDTYGYAHGMLVTHIDYLESKWTSNTVNTDSYHQRCTIIPADGQLLSSMFAGNQQAVASGSKEYLTKTYCNSMAGDPFPGTAYTRDDTGFSFEPIDSLTGKKAMVFTKTGSTPGMMNQPITDIVEHEDGTITLRFCGGNPDYIETISYTRDSNDGSVYDLSGRKIATDKLPVAKGIYIINGRKYYNR